MHLRTQPLQQLSRLNPVAHRSGENVSQAERLACLAGGSLLAAYGISRFNPAGIALSVIGGLFVYRGLSGKCELYHQLGIDTAHRHRHPGVPGNRGIKIEKTILINRPATQVYHYWRRLGNLPRFMPHLKSVQERGQRYSHWVVEGPAGSVVEWDAQIINDRPGEMISWQSVPGATVENAGSVWFIPVKNDPPVTRLKISLQYNPPAGLVGGAVARLFREAPDRQLDQDLVRFKELIESDIDSMDA